MTEKKDTTDKGSSDEPFSAFVEKTKEVGGTVAVKAGPAMAKAKEVARHGRARKLRREGRCHVVEKGRGRQGRRHRRRESRPRRREDEGGRRHRRRESRSRHREGEGGRRHRR